MGKRKVLNIIQRYYPAKGGAELFMKTLSEYQHNNLGYEVDVWTTNAYAAETLWDLGGDVIENEKEIISGINVRRFSVGEGLFKNKYLNKILRILFDRCPNFKVANLASCPTSFGMLKMLRRMDFSDYEYITVSSTPYYFLFYVGYLISKKYNIPYVIVPAFHIGEGKEDSLREKYFKKTSIPFFKHARKIILNTEAEKKAIVDFCKINDVNLSDEKFVILGQGLFLNQIGNGDGNRFRRKYNLKYPIVFQIGSKNYDKGSINLVESMKIIWDKGFKCHLIFGGQYNKDFSEYLKIVEGKYSRYILNIDDISEEEKWDLFDAGDIFSMISKTDSFGIVYLEAWAYAKPVLAFNNEALSEIVDNGKNGCLLKFDDIELISRTIEKLLRDTDLSHRVGKSGKEKLEKEYNWSKNLKKLDYIYKIRES